METDQLFFKEIIVWVIMNLWQIETIYEEGYLINDVNLAYPFFTIDHQGLNEFEMFMNV